MPSNGLGRVGGLAAEAGEVDGRRRRSRRCRGRRRRRQGRRSSPRRRSSRRSRGRPTSPSSESSCWGNALLGCDVGREHAGVGHALGLGDLGGVLVHGGEVGLGESAVACRRRPGWGCRWGRRSRRARRGPRSTRRHRAARTTPRCPGRPRAWRRRGSRRTNEDEDRGCDDPLGDGAGELAGYLSGAWGQLFQGPRTMASAFRRIRPREASGNHRCRTTPARWVPGGHAAGPICDSRAAVTPR